MDGPLGHKISVGGSYVLQESTGKQDSALLVLMDHVTSTRPTADLFVGCESRRSIRPSYPYTLNLFCIMFAVPPARADRTPEASLQGTSWARDRIAAFSSSGHKTDETRPRRVAEARTPFSVKQREPRLAAAERLCVTTGRLRPITRAPQSEEDPC